MCESCFGPWGAFFASFFLANSSENAVRATAGCELLRVRAARVVTLKNRVRAAAVVRHAVWCDLRIFFSEFIIKKVRAAVGCELLRVRHAYYNVISVLWVRVAARCEMRIF